MQGNKTKANDLNCLEKVKKSRYLIPILAIILNLSETLLPQLKNKVDFEPGTSYQSKSSEKKPKKPPQAIISPDEKHYFLKENKRLSCLNFSSEKGDDVLEWVKVFKSQIVGVTFDSQSGDRILVTVINGIQRADIKKGNFEYISKEKKWNGIRASPEGDSYAASKDKGLIFGNSQTGDVWLRIQKAHDKKIKFFDFISKDRLLTIGEDNIIKVWNQHTGEAIMNSKIHPSHIQAAALTFDRKHLIIGTYDFNIHLGLQLSARPTDVKEIFRLKIIDTTTLSIIKEIDGTTDNIFNISLSADNKLAAVVKKNNTIDVWDLENGYIIRSFSGEPYSDAEFDSQGKNFLLVTETGKVQRYITRGIITESTRPQYVGERYKINTPSTPIITRNYSGMTIAVLDFTSLLIDSQVSEAMSYSFRNRISNYSYIRVVERDEMNKILKEQGIQNSGVTTPEQAAEIGKVLNAKKLIMGKLTGLGSTLITTIKVVDVESAQIEGGREVECQNYALENLPEIIDILLNILVEK